MREKDAGVAETGQRRWLEGPVPKGSEGSNPSPRIILPEKTLILLNDINLKYPSYMIIVLF